MSIIEKGWIYARHKANEAELMRSDNASQAVLSVSSSKIKEYARLYFRPKTPTQYHNEGYKPVPIRNSELNANCPVPIFFFLDAEKTLCMDGVKFSETTCAGTNELNLLSGEKSFSTLPFEKIYHDGYFSPENRDDIICHRQAEIVRVNGICINDCLKGIVCRTPAEKQTFLYLLKTQYPEKYRVYKDIIRCDPSLDMFYNNGIFIRNVQYDGILSVLLNDASKRRTYTKTAAIVKCDMNVHYIAPNGNVIGETAVSKFLEYLNEKEIFIELPDISSDYAVTEIYFDDILMYKNLINLSTGFIV